MIEVKKQSILQPSNLTANPFELLYKRSNPLKNGLFLGQVLWVQRAHSEQNSIELSSALARILALQ